MRMRRLLNTLTLTLAMTLVAAGCGRTGEDRAAGPSVDPRDAFMENLRALCAKSFEGRGVHSATENDPMLQARLVMHVTSCSERELRIPFHVDDDRSRTWILTRSPQGLLLKHDNRHEDGTPDELTNYGGWSHDGGTALRQSFPADEDTARMLPAAATNVWTLEMVPGQRFVYDLTRHGQPRFRAEFDLRQPLEKEEPPRP